VRGGWESRLALGLAFAAAVMLGASLAGAQGTAKLRQHQRVLATRSHTALLGLYALDSRLAQARSELVRIHALADRLRVEQEQVRQELTVVGRNVKVSQRVLGEHLRTLYEEGEPNAIAILLGSASLGSPGVEELRWTAPVRPGDTLTGRSTITDTQPSKTNASRGTVFTTNEVYNQNGELVMTLKARGFFARKGV